MKGLTVRNLQERVRMQARERYSDDLIKLASIDLWLDEIHGLHRHAEDVLFDLEIRYGKAGFGGDSPDVAGLKRKFTRIHGAMLHRLVMTANAAGIDLEESMLDLLNRENP